MLKDKIKNFIKDIARETFDEMQPKEDDYSMYSLPELKKNEYLAMSIQQTHANIKPHLPAGVAMDSAVSQNFDKLQDAYNISNPVNDIIYTHFATQGFIGFQACAILTQNWLINKACLLPAKDAISPEYELSYVTTDDTDVLDEDFLTEITDISNDTSKFDIKNVCKTFAEKKRQFGQILAFPVIEGADYSQPFNIDSIRENTYKGMTVIEPVWYQAIFDEDAINNPQSLNYMKPSGFMMPDGKIIHHSWCIFGKNGEVPDILKPTYRWGGYPIPQLIYKRAYAAERTANEAPMLAQSKRLLVADVNPMGLLTNPQDTIKKVETITQFRDNWGVFTKRPGDNVSQIDTSLTDFDEVIMTQYQLTAAAAGMPATKLLETQPKGFNSTGEYEDDQYKLLLVAIQKEDFTPILDMHYAILAMSKYGIKRDFTINFVEIDTPTEKERAEINEIKARTDASYIQAGVFSPDEVRDNVVKDANSGYNDIVGELEEGVNEPSFFDDEEQEGNGNTSQNPFSMDAKDEWFTVHPNGKENEGRPVYAEGGENKADAIKRRFGSVGKGKNSNSQSKTNNNTSNNVHKKVSDYENKNHSLNYETGAVFDDDGNTIVEFSGQEHEIFISDEDMKKLEGKTFTHNHPNGSTFSRDDLVSGFLTGKVKELRATTPQGVTFSLKSNGNSNDELTKKMIAEYQQVSLRATRQFKEKCIREIKMGTLSLDDYNKNMYNMFQPYLHQKLDNFFEQHAEEYGFTYRKDNV